MNREEILAKAQSEGREQDLPEQEAEYSGTWMAYLIGMVLLFLVILVNSIARHRVDFGAFFVLAAMCAAMSLTKYRKLRKKHELVVAILWGIVALTMFAGWILEMVGVF